MANMVNSILHAGCHLDEHEFDNIPDPTITQNISMEVLPNEILDKIIVKLDPPSAVCLALTSHRLYSSVLAYTEVQRLDEICPKSYYQQPSRRLRRYVLDRSLPHYRNPEKYCEYATGFGISLQYFNPAYVQLLLCLRSFMAPRYVFCFASSTTRYVPRRGGHVCSACQSERRYLAQKELHDFAARLTRYASSSSVWLQLFIDACLVTEEVVPFVDTSLPSKKLLMY